MIHNPNCDGDKCRANTGEVRVYPLGAGGNLILCQACWTNENRYRLQRQINYMRDSKTYTEDMKRAIKNWPQVDWSAAEVYGNEQV